MLLIFMILPILVASFAPFLVKGNIAKSTRNDEPLFQSKIPTLNQPQPSLLRRSVGTKGVFAHFIVGNVALWAVSNWENDMKLAQDAYIDAFVLNIAYGEKSLASSLSNAFIAANNLGFKLLFSFDYAANGPWPLREVLDLVKNYGTNAAYYMYNTKPLVSTFEGVESASDWATIKSQSGCYFIPSYSSLGTRGALDLGVADGLFGWAGWPSGNNNMNTNLDMSYQRTLGKMPYMMAVSPWFFTNLPQWNKNWLWRGDDLWYDRWEEAISIQPEFVEIISWNDYGESHYIGPLSDSQYGSLLSAPYNYALGMPHDGWRLLLPYVIQRYKSPSSKPVINSEGLVIWYRRHPRFACNTGGTTGNTASHQQVELDPAFVVQDKIFYSALLRSPGAAIKITIGNIAQVGTWNSQPKGGIGIYHGSVGFDGAVGNVTVQLSRYGTTIAKVIGVSITTKCKSGVQNWNAWVGSNSVI